jgi:hypothetical protein
MMTEAEQLIADLKRVLSNKAKKWVMQENDIAMLKEALKLLVDMCVTEIGVDYSDEIHRRYLIGKKALAQVERNALASQNQEPYGYVRAENVDVGNVIEGQWLNSTKVDDDDVPVYLAQQPDLQTKKLIEAAEALIQRWHTPLWKDVPATGEFIYKLEQAVKESKKNDT